MTIGAWNLLAQLHTKYLNKNNAKNILISLENK